MSGDKTTQARLASPVVMFGRCHRETSEACLPQVGLSLATCCASAVVAVAVSDYLRLSSVPSVQKLLPPAYDLALS
jgi:hypothetical protein